MGQGHDQREKLTVYLDHQLQGFYTSPDHPQSHIGVSTQTAPDWSLVWGHLSQDHLDLWHWEPLSPQPGVLSLLTTPPGQQTTEIHVYASPTKDHATLALVQRLCEEQLAITPLVAAMPAECFRTYFCEAPGERRPQERWQAALLAIYQHYWYDRARPPAVTIESVGLTALMGQHEYFYTVSLDGGKLTCHVYEQADRTFRITTHPTRGQAEYSTRRAVLAAARRYFGWGTQSAMYKAIGREARVILTEESLEGQQLSFGRTVDRLWCVCLGGHTCFVGILLHPRTRSLAATYLVSCSRV